MNKHNIYFLEVEVEDKDEIKKAFPKAKVLTGILTEDKIIKQCVTAEILCPFIYSKITSKVIKSLPNLKLIITRSVGYNHIDLVEAQKNDVIVCNVPDYGSHVIAEHVFALLLSGLRHITEGGERVEQESTFSFTGLRGIALKGKSLGIIGTGKIGKHVARIASSGFLMNVLAHDPMPDKSAALENHYEYVSLETIWKKADIITLHCPLVETTKHLINTSTLAKMKEGVVIVNTSRGGVIDTPALIKSLNSKRVSHAFLDVLEHEDNLKKNKKLIESPNVIVTPHIAFYADDSMGKMYEESFMVIRSFLKKKEIVNQVKGL